MWTRALINSKAKEVLKVLVVYILEVITQKYFIKASEGNVDLGYLVKSYAYRMVPYILADSPYIIVTYYIFPKNQEEYLPYLLLQKDIIDTHFYNILLVLLMFKLKYSEE